jgi:hypothetical protein
MVKVIALNEPEPEPEIRRLGFFTGEMIVPDDFDTLYQDEIEEMFYGKE